MYVKDTDRSNQADSEIDSEVKIFDIFGHFRPFAELKMSHQNILHTVWKLVRAAYTV